MSKYNIDDRITFMQFGSVVRFVDIVKYIIYDKDDRAYKYLTHRGTSVPEYCIAYSGTRFNE